jgi:hypothetical protein
MRLKGDLMKSAVNEEPAPKPEPAPAPEVTLAGIRKEVDAGLPEDANNRAAKIRTARAKEYLRHYLSAGKYSGDERGAIAIVIGQGGRISPKQAILDRILAEGAMTDLDCFKEFNKGPAEMRAIIKYGVTGVYPEKRVWIAFADGVYSVVGTGEKPPANWLGAMPETEAL